MFFSKFLITLNLLALLATPTSGPTFRGSAAFLYTKKAVSYGERPSGSEAISHLREWIVSELKPLKGQLSLQSFTGQTPIGPVPMVNIVYKFPGSSGKALVVTGHYDTKRIPMVHFVGANDSGSSTGFLLEFARAVSLMKHRDDIYLVFFDGEEAVANWTETDSRYGSRYLAAKWLSEGTLPSIKALINVDMIGDKDLDVSNDGNSSRALRSQVRQIAAHLGYSKYFRSEEGGIEDDHLPFINAGVNAIDLIDIDFGPHNSYWHTAEDTVDKLDAHSFQVMGDVVLQLVKELDGQS
ncbi:MAG: M28 family peptidase [Acidobacteriaceae bacterium]|nr:M28 family peptidase [Acidobacteriaceae bacterium]